MAKTVAKKVGTGSSMLKKSAKGLVAAGALAAAIGGIYMLAKKQKSASKSAKSAGAWILRAKADVMEEVEKLPEVSRQAYQGIVSSVLKHYGKLKDVSKSELASLKKDLEGEWKNVTSGLKKD